MIGLGCMRVRWLLDKFSNALKHNADVIVGVFSKYFA